MAITTHLTLTIADRARRAAKSIDYIALVATGDQPAASRLEGPLQLADMIDFDIWLVAEWIERRCGSDRAASLREATAEILAAIHEPPRKAPSGALILDLFIKARQLAYRLRRWADDIEDAEDSQPLRRSEAKGSSTPPPAEAIPYTSPLCSRDLARMLRDRGYSRATDNAVEIFLRRYRENYPDSCHRKDRDDRRRNEAEYTYRPEVWPYLVEHFSKPQRQRLTDET
jgi:hypothetical protein